MSKYESFGVAVILITLAVCFGGVCITALADTPQAKLMSINPMASWYICGILAGYVLAFFAGTATKERWEFGGWRRAGSSFLLAVLGAAIIILFFTIWWKTSM